MVALVGRLVSLSLRCSALFSSLSVALISFILLCSALLSIFSGGCNFFRVIVPVRLPRYFPVFKISLSYNRE